MPEFTQEDADVIAEELADSYLIYFEDGISVGRDVEAFWNEENKKWLVRYNEYLVEDDGEGMLFPTINQWPYEGEVVYDSELGKWEIEAGEWGSEEAIEFENLPDLDIAAQLIAERFVEHFVCNWEDEKEMLSVLKDGVDAHPKIKRAILKNRADVAETILKRLWLKLKLFFRIY